MNVWPKRPRKTSIRAVHRVTSNVFFDLLKLVFVCRKCPTLDQRRSAATFRRTSSTSPTFDAEHQFGSDTHFLPASSTSTGTTIGTSPSTASTGPIGAQWWRRRSIAVVEFDHRFQFGQIEKGENQRSQRSESEVASRRKGIFIFMTTELNFSRINWLLIDTLLALSLGPSDAAHRAN